MPAPDPRTSVDEAASRDHPEAPIPEPPHRAASGRPADLQPGHRVETIRGGDRWLAAEAFVYDLYRSIGYCDESPTGQVEELARWSDRSRFHAVSDETGDVIGTVRNIFGGFAELPVGQFQRTDDTHPDPVCELSSLCVRTDVRSTGVIEHLYREAWLDAFRSGSRAVVALIDEWLFEVFRDTYRLPFTKVGISEHYMGSDPVPVAMPLVGAAYEVTARENPDFWAWTLEAVQPHEAQAWDLPIVLGRNGHQPVAPTRRARQGL